MNQPPIVSVLMTAYNREQFIAAAIESVLSQTFHDFELIIVDDQSTDRTVEIAREYAARDARITVVVNDTRLGDYPNRNRAARLARGEYLKYHDSDDVMYAHCLSVMHGMLDGYPQAAFALSASAGWPGGPCPMLLTPRLAFLREFLGHGLFYLGPASALFRAGSFRDLGGFPEAGPGSDYLFWLRACQSSSVLLVPGDLFHWRIHFEQELSRSTSPREYARVSAEAWHMLNSAECPLRGAEVVQARRNWAFIVARGALREIKSGAWRRGWDIWRYSGLTCGDLMRYLRPPRRSRLAGVPQATNG
jgi:glycosyltransferase involved in cell wall biosynthesis